MPFVILSTVGSGPPDGPIHVMVASGIALKLHTTDSESSTTIGTSAARSCRTDGRAAYGNNDITKINLLDNFGHVRQIINIEMSNCLDLVIT